MKRFILVLILSLLLIPSVLAKTMYQFNVTMNIEDDDSTGFKLDFKFTDDIKIVEVPLNGEITDLSSDDGKCIVKVEEVGNILSCEPPSPFMVGTIQISANFKSKGFVEKRGNISFFSIDIPVLWSLQEAYITAKLPDKTVLAEKVLLPISPSGVNIGSDGRRIITSWHFLNKNTGDLIPIRIYYEYLTPKPFIEDYSWAIISIIGIVIIFSIVVIAIVFKGMSYKKSKLVFSVLNENEKMIVDIIKKENKEEVDQRRIVGESGFSKAKVSRIIQSLEERGVVESERIGRKNKIRLIRRFIKEEK